MIDDAGKKLWERVCTTVTRLGGPRQRRAPSFMVAETPPSTLDLHGYTVEEAYRRTHSFIVSTPHHVVTIITGKSGQIKSEFEHWLSSAERVREVCPTNDGGAYVLKLRK